MVSERNRGPKLNPQWPLDLPIKSAILVDAVVRSETLQEE